MKIPLGAKILKQIFVALGSLVSFVSLAQACRCGDEPSLQKAVSYYDVIFIGRLTKMTLEQRPAGITRKDAYFEIVACEFSKVEALKGEPSKDGKMTVVTNVDGASCGYSFRIAEEYLVFARISDGELKTSKCDRTRPSAMYADYKEVVDGRGDNVRYNEVPKLKKLLRGE